MKYIKLGNSDLSVSCICMGCMGFGDAGNGQHKWTIDEEHTGEIIRHGLDSGLIFMILLSHIRAEQVNSILEGR